MMDDEPNASPSASAPQDKDLGAAGASHEAMYKNRGLTPDKMRRRREMTTVEIRKQKREQDLNKRRQIDLATAEVTEQLERECVCSTVDERIIGKLCGESTKDIEEALDVYRRRFRKSNASEVADEIVALNLVPRIVELSKVGQTLNIRRIATHIIGAIVSICSTHTEAIVKTGAVEHLVHLIGDPDRDLRELTLFALGNIASESRFRNLCIECGMVQKLVRIPNDMKLMEARCAVWAASNLCRGKEPPVKLEEIAVLIPLFNEALYSGDTLIISDACRAFSRLLEAVPESSYNVVLKPGTVERLVGHMGNPNPKISTAALLAVGNVVSGDDEHTQSVVTCPNALNNLHRLLLDGDQRTKCEVCWVLSNIAAGTASQIQTIFDAGIIATLVHILKVETFQLRIEACWVIANAITGGNKEHIAGVVREGALIPLSDMLTVMDSNIVVVILRALEEILQCGECCKVDGRNPYLTKLEELQTVKKLEFLTMSPNSEIFGKACDIMEKYFLRNHEEAVEVEVVNNDTALADTVMEHFDFS